MLKTISNLEGVKKLDKNSQKAVNGGRDSRICGGTGATPINRTQAQCGGYGIQWYNGQCYACH